jgi:hypothetical protein
MKLFERATHSLTHTSVDSNKGSDMGFYLFPTDFPLVISTTFIKTHSPLNEPAFLKSIQEAK